MTSIVAILCQDGAVIGTDSAATLGGGGQFTVEQPVDKIEIVNEQIIIAGTGAVGLNQRFCHEVQRLWDDRNFRQGDTFAVTMGISQAALGNFQRTFSSPVNRPPLDVGYGAVVAFPCGRNLQLCEFEVGSLQPELKNAHPWYCSMGSAQPITDAFLGFIRSVFWDHDQPNLAEGIFYTVWTLQQAINLNTGGVNSPINIAVIERDGNAWKAHKLADDEFQQHQQHVDDVTQHLADFRGRFASDSAADLPAPPKP